MSELITKLRVMGFTARTLRVFLRCDGTCCGPPPGGRRGDWSAFVSYCEHYIIELTLPCQCEPGQEQGRLL